MGWGDNDPVVGAAPAAPSWGVNDKPVAGAPLIPTQTESIAARSPDLAPMPDPMGTGRKMDAVSAGLNAGVANAVKVVPMAAGGALSLMHAPDALQDAAFGAVKGLGDYAGQAQAAGQQISPGATTVGNVLSLVPQLAGGEAALPETAGTALAENAPRLAQIMQGIQRGAPLAGLLGSSAATAGATGILDQGGSASDAEKLYGASLPANTAANLLPMGAVGNPLLRALAGGAANVAGGMGAQEAEHMAAPDYAAAPTLADAKQQGAVGALMGLMLGHGVSPEIERAEPVATAATFGADDPVAPDLGNPQQAAAPSAPAQAPTDSATQAAQDAAQAATAHATSGATAAGLVAKNAAEAGLSAPDVAAHAAAADAMVDKDPDAEVPLHPATPINATGSVPLGGGVSQDGQTIYIDKRIPQFVDVPGPNGEPVQVDAHDVIAHAHEAPEFPQMDQQGKDYADAHNVNANTYEAEFLAQKYGVDHDEFNKALEPYLKQAQEQGAHAPDIPTDLDRTPYIDDGKEHLLEPKAETAATLDNAKGQATAPDAERNAAYEADQYLTQLEHGAMSAEDRGAAVQSLGVSLAPEDHAEALTVADLVDRAVDAGVPHADIIKAASIGDIAQRARALWDLSYQPETNHVDATEVQSRGEGSDQPPAARPTADHGDGNAPSEGIPAATAGAETDAATDQRPTGPDATEPVARSETTGIKNATVAEERAFKGKDEVDYEGKRTFGDAWDKASEALKNEPSRGADLAQAIIEKPRPLSAEESATLIQDRMRLHNAFRETNAQIDDAMTAGDIHAEAMGRARLRALEDAMETNDRASRASGYEQGFGLVARRMMSRQDYSMAELVTRGKVAAGRELGGAERARLDDLAKQIEEKDAQIAELQKQRAQRKAGTSGAQRKTADQNFKDLSAKLKAIREADQLVPGCVV